MQILAIIKLRLFVILLLFLVFFNTIPNFASSQEESCQLLMKLGILKGYPDGSLKLENKLTRSEFITVIIRAKGYDKNTDVSNCNIQFEDVDPDHWANKNIKIAVRKNLIKGYTDNTFRPDKNVSYAEALTIILNVTGHSKELSGTWPNSVVDKATNLGLTNGLNLPPNKLITRGEMCQALFNVVVMNPMSLFLLEE